ncbi:hypothetical protein OHA99_29875 [Streptomyces coelicoflavus]|uniref:hypothetical protein n=1 Tax=Streptomyces coelicoflavus TaxID=285562 RepID=UPI00324BE9F7
MPLVAASLGFSGSRSMTRNRYSSGHCMKSPAREGESEAGAVATDAGETASVDASTATTVGSTATPA